MTFEDRRGGNQLKTAHAPLLIYLGLLPAKSIDSLAMIDLHSIPLQREPLQAGGSECQDVVSLQDIIEVLRKEGNKKLGRGVPVLRCLNLWQVCLYGDLACIDIDQTKACNKSPLAAEEPVGVVDYRAKSRYKLQPRERTPEMLIFCRHCLKILKKSPRDQACLPCLRSRSWKLVIFSKTLDVTTKSRLI